MKLKNPAQVTIFGHLKSQFLIFDSMKNKFREILLF